MRRNKESIINKRQKRWNRTTEVAQWTKRHTRHKEMDKHHAQRIRILHYAVPDTIHTRSKKLKTANVDIADKKTPQNTLCLPAEDWKNTGD